MKFKSHPFWLEVFALSLIILVIIGTYFVFSVSFVESVHTFGSPFALAKQQVVGIALGFLIFIIGLITPNAWWQKTSLFIYLLALILLVLVFFPPLGLSLNGASRWINLGRFVFQPVELMKLALIIYFASWLTKHQKSVPFLILLGLPVILVMLQPDFGSMLVLGGIGLSLYFLAGANKASLLKIGLLIIPIFTMLVIMAPYRLARITTYLNPDQDLYGAGFHVRQISLALGRGGLLGQGLGNSLQKYAYIPEISTDSIFAVVGEELGFLGGVSFILIFSLFIYAGYKLVTLSHLSSFQQLMGLGLLAMISLQALINLSAVVGLIPLTGIPLPFISYGRSSQVMLFLSSGMIAHIGLTKS